MDPAPRGVRERKLRALTAFSSAILFLSGAAALIDEHLLSRLLVPVVGSSAEAVACVLVAFMGGMGVGAALTARYLTKGVRVAAGERAPKPLQRYAAIEAGIAFTALMLPATLSLLVRAYARMASGSDTGAGLLIVRFVVAVLVVSVPGILMGATLPLLLDGIRRLLPGEPLPLARFYAMNTFGAALGVFASTYVLVPELGIYGTLAVAASCNAIAAVGALGLLWSGRSAAVATAAARAGGAEEKPRAEVAPELTMRRSALMAFASGGLAFAFEVVCFRLLAVVVGNSVYAFGLMLFVFLMGNGIGSRIAASSRRSRPLALALVQGAVGITSLALMPLWDKMPGIFQQVGLFAPSFFLWEGTRFFVIAVLIGLPTLAMGCSFGFLLRLGGGEDVLAPARVARLYVANMLGAITGVLLTTFVIAPLVGSRAALMIIGFGETALAAAALVPAAGTSRLRLSVAGGLSLVVALIVLVSPTWNLSTLMSGSNVYFSEGFARHDRLRRLAEDRSGGIVAVVENEGVRTLIANGKFEGNDGFEVPDQQMCAIFPLLFVKKHEAALNIGLGTANTLAVMGAFPFKRLDVAELSGAMVDAARAEFSHLNRNILDDPRVHMNIDDGRNFLLRTPTRYDLIAVQVSSIWIGGSADLYGTEFYEASRARLAQGGIFKQWLQIHHIKSLDMARVIATMRTVFPHVTLWLAGHQSVLVASMEPLIADAQALEGWTKNVRLHELLTTSNLGHPYAAFGHYYMDEIGLDAFVDEVMLREHVGPRDLISRDGRPLLEYSTPRGNLLVDAVGDNMELLRRNANPLLMDHITNVADENQRRILLAYAAQERGFVRLAGWELKPLVDNLRTGEHAPLVQAIDKADKEEKKWP